MIKIALFQMQAAAGDVEGNLGKIERAARQAAEEQADILVTPELAIPGYGAGDKMVGAAEARKGSQLKQLQHLAEEIGIALIVGFAERAKGLLYNSSVFIDAGKEPVIYRKSHLYGLYEKSRFTAHKPETVTFDINGCRCGMLICYDVEFPENVRRLAQAGVDLVLVPTALPVSDHGSFIARTLVPARAFENQVAVVYANHTGRDSLFAYQGLSTVAAPDGKLLVAASETAEDVFFAEIDFSVYEKSRQENSYLIDLDGDHKTD